MTCTADVVVESVSQDPVPSSVTDNTKRQGVTTLSRAQLIEAVTFIMQDIIQAAGKSFTCATEIPNVTVFHASTLPGISIQDYLTRFSFYAKCEDDVLIYALIYLDRIGELIKGFSLDSFNVHKLLLVTLSVACKFCDDRHFTNTYYADVGGISAKDFNIMEQEYLVNYLQFGLYVKTETYNAYYSDVINYYQNKLLQNQP